MIDSDRLEAFVAAARAQNFSRAAETIHITQSALSQRIHNLEKDLGLTLFVRDSKNVSITEAGARLLRYCRMREALESEALGELRAKEDDSLTGWLRIAGYSTVTHSLALPALEPLLRTNRRVRFELAVREIRELPRMLIRGEADFILLDQELKRTGIEGHLLGHESYVLAESARFKGNPKVFLDHDTDDPSAQKCFPNDQQTLVERSHVDDIYGICRGVSLGLGRGLIPRHLLQENRSIRSVRGFKPISVPVYLHYHLQPYYSKLHLAAVEALRLGVARHLSAL